MSRYAIEQVANVYYIKDTQIEGDDGYIGPYTRIDHAQSDIDQFEREDRLADNKAKIHLS